MNVRQMLEEIKARGYSQSEIATVTNLSNQYISDLVLGVRGKRASYDAVNAIHKMYKSKKYAVKK